MDNQLANLPKRADDLLAATELMVKGQPPKFTSGMAELTATSSPVNFKPFAAEYSQILHLFGR